MLDHAIATTTRRVVALLVVAPLVLIASSGQPTEAKAESQKDSGVALSAMPQRMDLLPQPCLPALLNVGFQSRSSEPTYTTAFIRAESPLRVSRDVVTTYVPTDYVANIAVEVYTPANTPPGEYEILLEAGRERVSVPIVVSQPPADPNRNVALGQETTASSTGGVLAPCGAVDGNHTYTLLGYNRPATAWADATPGEFPDQLQTNLAEPATVGRVDLYTHAEQRFALKDWDVQVLTSAGWQTVAQVRGHSSGLFSSSFEPVTATAVRINILASNGYAYSTVVELEVYGE